MPIFIYAVKFTKLRGITMTKKTLEQFIEIINPVLEEGGVTINYGECEGTNVVVFDTWKDVEYIEAYINGFEGLTSGKPHIHSRNTFSLSTIIEVRRLLVDAYPNHYYYQGELKQLTEYLLYTQYLATLDHDPIELDDFDFDVVFSDEYSYCSHCYAIIRTSPDCYDWTPPLFLDGEGYACDTCVNKGQFDDYILEEYCNDQKSIPDSADLGRLGLVKVNQDSYQNGMHSGMDDSPKPIIESLNKHNIDVWFKVQASQFYVEFDVYVKEADKEKATAILNGTDTYQGFSNSINLQKCLSQISPSNSKDGIHYATCDISTGTVKSRVVSEQEFIQGIKK
jgi:hypothetical protein